MTRNLPRLARPTDDAALPPEDETPELNRYQTQTIDAETALCLSPHGSVDTAQASGEWIQMDAENIMEPKR